MRIRFFNTYEPVTSLYRDVIPALAKRGAQVDIVVSRGEYRKGRDLTEAFAPFPEVRLKRMVNFGLNAYQGLYAKILVAFGYVLNASVYSLFGPGVDRNVFLTQPPFFPVVGYFLHLFRRQPYQVILMDLQPDLSVAIGAMKPEQWSTRMLSWTARLTLRNAETVIVIGRCMGDYVESLGVATDRIRFIPNWANEGTIRPVANEQNQLREADRWGDKTVVMYAGNIGLPQHFDDILEVAGELSDREDLLFVFIGEGVRRKRLEAEISRRGLPNVLLYPFLHETYPLADVLAAGDVHLVTLREACTGIAVPSKTYGILAVGRPVIYQGSREAEIARLVAEGQIGYVIATGDVEGLKHAVLRYADEPGQIALQGRRARRLAETVYSRRRAISQYTATILGDSPRKSVNGVGR